MIALLIALSNFEPVSGIVIYHKSTNFGQVHDLHGIHYFKRHRNIGAHEKIMLGHASSYII